MRNSTVPDDGQYRILTNSASFLTAPSEKRGGKGSDRTNFGGLPDELPAKTFGAGRREAREIIVIIRHNDGTGL
jgi:hypothetical protein